MIVDMAERVGIATFSAQTRIAVNRVDSSPRLSAISCPMMLIAGAEDVLCPPERHVEITERVPTARSVVLDGVGHFAPLEAPGRTLAILQQWLEETDDD